MQLYTGLIYGGPGLVRPLAQALSAVPKRARLTTGLGALLDHAACSLIVDLWEVMHNGEALFPEALDALMQAQARG